MPDDQNTSQNPTPEENSIPTSPQEPTADAPIPPIDSEPAEAPSDAPEAPRERFSDESNNIPPSNSTSTEAENEQKTEEKSAPNEPNSEPVSEPVQTIEPSTAQMAGNEPLVEPEQVKILNPNQANQNRKPQSQRRKRLRSRSKLSKIALVKIYPKHNSQYKTKENEIGFNFNFVHEAKNITNA